MSRVATSSHHSDPTSGIDRNSAKRNRSQMTMTRRRSNLSASTPASGPEHQSGQQLGGDDAAEREALGLVAGGELRGERGQREETQPVARRRDGRDEPEATERGDGQHAAHAVRRGRGQRAARRPRVARAECRTRRCRRRSHPPPRCRRSATRDCTPVVQLPARVAGRSDSSADRHVRRAQRPIDAHCPTGGSPRRASVSCRPRRRPRRRRCCRCCRRCHRVARAVGVLRRC